ncbi:MAG: hypothetical protein HYZ42_11000 [Bacteroidetes bacterium]|nr:hypothetical protein [Bacteroidota bacterium]
MKKSLFLFIIFALLQTTQSFAQAPNDLVTKENLTVDYIKKIFENSYYEIKEVKDDYVKIKDVFSIYIDVAEDKRYITLSVTWPLNTNFTDQQRYELLNLINKDVLLTTA